MCWREIGAYNDKHPKGNKIRSEELIARRDGVFHLVETGLIYAQLIAERARQAAHAGARPVVDTPEPSKPSLEAKRFLKALLSDDATIHAPASKLSLLNEQDRAYVLDAILRKAGNTIRPNTSDIM